MDIPIISPLRYTAVLLSQFSDSHLVFPGPRHLSHRAQGRKGAVQEVTLRESQRQRSPSPLARFSSHQLRRYPVSRPSYRPSRSSSERLRVWQGCIPREYTPYFSPIHRKQIVTHVNTKVFQADISSKSANYCQSHASSNTGLLLLCEVELGKPMFELETGRSDAAELAKQRGCIATWGKGATVPMGWKDAGCVNADLAGVMMVRV